VEAVAAKLAPAFDELIRQAAQGEVLHNDDTTVKILELMGEGRSKILAQGEGNDADQRTGLFTSGVVALRDGRKVALFFSGHRHAGENLAEVLKHRAAELPPPIQMCDALSRNLPGELRTILAHCLAHARRNFVDVYDRFPQECGHLLETLAVVYRNDATARERGLSAQARLQFHQEVSQPTMHELHAWLKRQLDEKLTEPNSALGSAIGCMLRHWEKLTLFLREPGAPLGRVERWRGGLGEPCVLPTLSVVGARGAPRTPSPPPAPRTGRAVFPHPALIRTLKPSHSAWPSDGREPGTAPVSRRGNGPGTACNPYRPAGSAASATCGDAARRTDGPGGTPCRPDPG
jgi:hypothetical protein